MNMWESVFVRASHQGVYTLQHNKEEGTLIISLLSAPRIFFLCCTLEKRTICAMLMHV
jgi:hypothetical protein